MNTSILNKVRREREREREMKELKIKRELANLILERNEHNTGDF